MASVFQRGGKWTAKYKDARGLWAMRSCGNADKATARRWAAAWEAEALDTREGRIDPRAQAYRDAEANPLDGHTEAFKMMLAAKGDTAEHVAETVAHVRRIIGDIGAERLSDLSADAVRRAIAAIRDSGGRSLRTCNSILRSVKTFAGWLEAEGHIRHNDLRHVAGYNADTDKRRVRRNLSNDELARIITAARAGPVAFKLSGEDRATAYMVAAGTGFRRGEVASLTPASFHVDDDAPYIEVTAGYSKRRRDDRQPIDPALAETLRRWLQGRRAGVRVFPLPDETAEMLRGDLRRAKARWIREASNQLDRRQRRGDDFLSVLDGAGRVLDFHAIRHHYISGIVASGASVKVAQELARHSSPVLTIGRYSHVRLADLRGAVPSVPTGQAPETQSQTLRATGTDNARVDARMNAPAFTAPLMHQIGRETVQTDAAGCEGNGTMRIVGDVEKSPVNCGKKQRPATDCGALRPARATGLEPATTGSTVRYSNQLSYAPGRPQSAGDYFMRMGGVVKRPALSRPIVQYKNHAMPPEKPTDGHPWGIYALEP